MTKENHIMLMELGRWDLLYIQLLNQSGYAGVNKDGQIVDRRIFPEAVAVQPSSVFPDIAEPKKV